VNISFIIITNSKKKEELLLQIKSIEHQNIQNYEILIVGDIDLNQKYSNSNIILIEDKYNADRGSLGGMRNKACEQAKYENLVISDDDMLFTKDWYKNLLKINQDFDIITPCVKVPDGTRFWDNACYMSPSKGHVILNEDETDDHLYMSGGQSWIIKKSAWSKVKWDEEFLIYKMKSLDDYNKGIHNEDTDFALRCRQNNLKIRHEPSVLVYHNDKSYTAVGRVIRRRYNNKDQTWCEKLDLPEEILIQFAISLAGYNFEAEAADILRRLKLNNSFSADQVFTQIEQRYGGPLNNSNFSFKNEEYLQLIETYKDV
jgi:hypothetical protein